MTAGHKAKLSRSQIRHYKKRVEMFERVHEIVKTNSRVMMKQSYKASELKKMGLSQGDVSFERESHHSDQAYGRRLYA